MEEKKSKIIKLSDIHYVIVDDGEIKEGVFDKLYFNTYDNRVWKYRPTPCPVPYWANTKTLKEIVFSTQPLEGVKTIPLSEIEEAIYGYSVEKMSKESFKDTDYLVNEPKYTLGYKNGFNAHKELVKDKLFTKEQLFEFAEEYSNHIRKCTKSNVINPGSSKEYFENPSNLKNRKITKDLLPKTEWDCTISEDGKITIIK